jgi:peptide/nickel transport system substrate-binding protein
MLFALAIALAVLTAWGSFHAATAAPRTDINLTIPSEMTSLDPYYTTALADLQILWQMYESLYYTQDDTTLAPRLAESHTLASDGRTYTFKLRKAKFHNGEPVTADDVVFSFQRAMKAPAMAMRVSPIESVRAVDPSTVEVKTKAVMTAALGYIVDIAILNKKAVEAAGDKFGTTVVDCGTGPYKVVKYDPSSRVELVAFDDYWRGAPAIKNVTYRIMPDTSSALIAFESGELDLVQIPLSNWAGIEESKKYTTVLAPENHISYLAFNISEKPFDNQKLRQAMACAVDKESIIIASYEGLAEPADFMLYPKYVADAPKDGVKYEYNPEKAKALMKEAGCADGIDVGPMIIIGSSYWPKIAQVLQQNFEEIGVTCSIQPMDTSAVIANMRKGTYGFGLMGLSLDRDFSYFSRLTHTRSAEVAAVKFRDPHIDELMDKGDVELDHAKRQAIYREANDYVQEICGFVPILYRSKPYAWSKNLNASLDLTFYFIYNFSWK